MIIFAWHGVSWIAVKLKTMHIRVPVFDAEKYQRPKDTMLAWVKYRARKVYVADMASKKDM